MTLVDFPKPNGKTVQEKYEYAKFLVLCKEPTLELLRFLEREKDNFTYRHLMDGGYKFSYDLVWSKGLLFDNLSRQDTTYPHYGVGGLVSKVTSRTMVFRGRTLMRHLCWKRLLTTLYCGRKSVQDWQRSRGKRILKMLTELVSKNG